MKKIAKVISKCEECPHFVKANSSTSGGKFDIAICGFEDDNGVKYDLLLYRPQGSVNDFTIGIPDNCPLETYKK
jgi:hypothetical protein